MCKSVEEYAERKAKEAAQKAAKEAAKEEKKATVNNLHDMGMAIELIAKAVNMDEETINKWLEK